MAVKKNLKPKAAVKKKVNAKAAVKKKVKAKVVAKKKVLKKFTQKPNPKKSNSKMEPTRKLMIKPETKTKSVVEKPNTENEPAKLSAKPVLMVKPALVVKRVINPLMARRPIKRSKRSNQFAYMKAPGLEHAFEVGDTVEVFCDHEKSRERIRGWVKGIVVQVDHKMVAVQFRSNVYLTDGWMVPDRILWYPVSSEHIRAVVGKKTVKDKKDFIPDY
jgi:hypothetical protein